MGRSGYGDDCDGDYNMDLYRNAVERAVRGKRGQLFFRQLADAMDAMPVKELIAGELVKESGEVCAMGVVCKARGLDVSKVDYENQSQVGKLLNIAPSLAAEVAFMNDDEFGYYAKKNETPAERWIRMRKWVQESL